MKKLIILFIVTLCTQLLIAQKYDYQWLFGKDSDVGLPFGGTVFDFNENPVDMLYEYRDMNLETTNASICDKEGNLQFYTNGVYIANSIHEPMENGEGLNPSQFTTDWSNSGLPIAQGALILPFPDHEKEYFLFHQTHEYESTYAVITPRLFYSHIDMNQNDGLGEVILKNEVIIEDTLNRGKITATQHANGRDWWVLAWKFNSNIYHRFLVSPLGVVDAGVDTLGVSRPNSLGQSVFSPDGSKYVRYTSVSFEEGQFIDIYDFDRCTGLLENHLELSHNDSAAGRGGDFTQFSIFVYFFSFKSLSVRFIGR